jgi:outer membrane protein TolC
MQTIRKCVVLAFLLSAKCFSCFAQDSVQLEDYITTALSRSPLLHEYRNTMLASKYDSDLIKAGYKPQVSLVSTNSYAPSLPNFGYDPAVTNGGTYSTVVNVSKTFASRSNLNTQYRSVGLSSDSVRNARLIAEQDLIRTVTAQYLTAYGDQQQLIANMEIRRLLGNESIILKRLTESNIYKQTDFLTFLVTQKQQELQLAQARIQYQTDYATLAYLCGIIDTNAFSKTLGLPVMAVRERPDALNSLFARRYLLDSLRLRNDSMLIRLAYRPKLGVFGDAGYNTSQINTVYRTFGVSAGFSINLPIYDGGRKKLLLNKIALQEDTRLAYLSFFERQYYQQTAQLRQQLSATESLLDQINAQIKYSRGLIDVNEKLMQTGDARVPDFVIAINNYLTARTLLTQNRISRLQIINQINYWSR